MKILIAYHSKNGTSEKCAQLLLKQVGAADLADLKKKTPDFESYDLIVIGGSIRMGMYTRCLLYTSMACDEILRAAMFLVRWKRRKWMDLSIKNAVKA